MNHLVIAFLELSVDVNVLDIETGKVLEDFIGAPGLYDLHPLLIQLRRHVLHFDLVIVTDN